MAKRAGTAAGDKLELAMTVEPETATGIGVDVVTSVA